MNVDFFTKKSVFLYKNLWKLEIPQSSFDTHSKSMKHMRMLTQMNTRSKSKEQTQTQAILYLLVRSLNPPTSKSGMTLS